MNSKVDSGGTDDMSILTAAVTLTGSRTTVHVKTVEELLRTIEFVFGDEGDFVDWSEGQSITITFEYMDEAEYNKLEDFEWFE